MAKKLYGCSVIILVAVISVGQVKPPPPTQQKVEVSAEIDTLQLDSIIDVQKMLNKELRNAMFMAEKPE